MFHSRDLELLACHDDQQNLALSRQKTVMVLDTIRNGIVYELLARSDDYIYSATSIIRTSFIWNLDYPDLLETSGYISTHEQRVWLMNF